MKKIDKIISRPVLLLAFWLLYLFATFFGFVRYKYMTKGGGVELLRILFSGIWKSSVIFLAVFLILLAYWIWKYLKAQVGNKSKIPINIIGISSIFMFYFSNQLLRLDNIYYSNYLYSKFGLTVSSVNLVSKISLYILFLYIFFILSEKREIIDLLIKESGLVLPLKSNKKVFSLLVFLVLLAYAFSPFTKFDSYLSLVDLPYSRFFRHFDYIEELKRVPENAKVILPAQSGDWPAIGNLPVSRYFLFPRELVSSIYLTDQNVAQGLGDLYFINLPSPTNDGSFWPNIDEANNQIIFKEGVVLNYRTLEIFYSSSHIMIYHIIF